MRRDGPLAPVDVSTLPHPGFATDLQAQMMVLLSLADGTSIVTENVFENRFVVVDELNRLGAGITTSGHHAVVAGPRALTASVVEAPDLRGGAALVTAGLVADGVTEVRALHHVERGYEDLRGKLSGLGADVSVLDEEAPLTPSGRRRLGNLRPWATRGSTPSIARAGQKPCASRRCRAAPRSRRRRGSGPGGRGRTTSPRPCTPSTPAAASSRRAARAASGDHRRRTAMAFIGALAAATTAVLLFWLYGRQPVDDAVSVVDVALDSGRIPSWLLLAAPAVGAVVLVAVTSYLAFGRHLSLKIVGLVVVVAGLAAPGFALGWTNGTLNTVGSRDEKVTEVVRKTRAKLQPPLPGKAVNLLLIGSDTRPDDPGRSDTQVIVRLDPVTRSISMLSLPRDLYVEIPGYGTGKINEAYTVGGPPLTVETVGAVTGLPIHHFLEINFDGFWHAVNLLDGVYYPVDRRYYNPESSTWKSIDLEPGYQLMDGHDALDFVRFRHDQRGDFSRMERQQSFIKELQRQSGRWNDDWRRVTKLLQAITDLTTSDLDSLQRVLPLASLALTLDTSKVYTVQLEGSPQMIGATSYVVASPEEIAAAVQSFSAPDQPSSVAKAKIMPKKAYEVHVYNANGVAGQATAAAQALEGLGYNAVAVGTLPTRPSRHRGVRAGGHGGHGPAVREAVRARRAARRRARPRDAGWRDGLSRQQLRWRPQRPDRGDSGGYVHHHG